MAGVESVTLTNQQMPVHNHPALATATGQQPSPEGAAFATPVSTQTGVNPNLVAAPAVPIMPADDPGRWAAASRTTTCSPIWSSPTSSRCSGFSRSRLISPTPHHPLSSSSETIMADPFVAEIRIFGFNFAPTGWAMCNGQIMPITQNTALFSLLGTFYGGDGKSTFALPNLQGSARCRAARARACRSAFSAKWRGRRR
jgi:microcystin-dependent protein